MTHATGGFSVDPERAPEAIRELESAVAELIEVQRQARFLARPNPGSRDSVSIEAAQRIGLVASGGPNSLEDAMTAGIQQINDLIASLKSDLAAYQSAESSTASRFDGERA